MIFQVQLNLTYWNELKVLEKKLNHSISFQLFVTLLRFRLGFNIGLDLIAHWSVVSEYSIRIAFLLPGLCFFFITLRTTDISCFLNNKNSKILYQSYFVLLKTSTLQLTVQSLNVKCHKTTANMEIFRYSSYKSYCIMKCFIAIKPNGALCFVCFI